MYNNYINSGNIWLPLESLSQSRKEKLDEVRNLWQAQLNWIENNTENTGKPVKHLIYT
jgi:hypothetical protein